MPIAGSSIQLYMYDLGYKYSFYPPKTSKFSLIEPVSNAVKQFRSCN